MRPPTAFPVVANCAACAIVSPSTSFVRRASHSPRLRSTASAARPYGATSGFAMANRLTPPDFTSRPKPSSRSSTARGEPLGANSTRRPTAYTTPASRVRPARESWLGNSSSAARNSSNGAPSWICRVRVPDAPKTSSTRPPLSRANCSAISVSAKLRFAATAMVGGRCAATSEDIPRRSTHAIRP